MRRIVWTALTLGLLTIAAAPAARANSIVDFVISGNGNLVTFSTPATTSVPNHPLFTTYYLTAPGVANGVTQSIYLAVFAPNTFFGLDLALTFGSSSIKLMGPELTVNTSTPGSNLLNFTFVPGVYSVADFNTGSPYSVAISPASAAVTPEPASLLLLATGAAPLMLMVRRRLAA